jgi:hypothetical protein
MSEIKRRRTHKPTTALVVVPPQDSIDYDEAVSEGKEIAQKIESHWWRLAELADNLVTKYGENTLERFAKDIGVVACTLDRHRSVYRAWKDFSAPGPKLNYAVARELVKHPDRFDLVRQNPDITKREASKIMRQLAGSPAGEDKWTKVECTRWFKSLCTHANEVIRDAQFAVGDIKPEHRRRLRDAIEPGLLPTFRKASAALIMTVEGLERFLDEDDDEAEAA